MAKYTFIGYEGVHEVVDGTLITTEVGRNQFIVAMTGEGLHLFSLGESRLVEIDGINNYRDVLPVLDEKFGVENVVHPSSVASFISDCIGDRLEYGHFVIHEDETE